jgi:DUF4097 and DUF4098 domain-containing protein YvlB
MSEQDTYDRTLDATPAASDQVPVMPPVAAPKLPDEEYYRGQPESQRGGRRSGLGVALVLIGLALLAFQFVGPGLTLGGTRTLVDETLPGSRIELSTTSANVEVRTWDEPTIRVEAVQRGGSEGDFDVDVSRSGDTVRVSETGRSVFWSLFGSRDLRYSIMVPAGAEADIRTASGEIDIEGVSGAVTLGTVSGDVRADELTGGLTVETTSGEVRLNDIAGTLSVGTISGDVKLEDGQVEDVTIHTTSGEIELDGVAGALNLGTVSADIKVGDASEGQLTVATTSGDISYDGGLAREGAHEVSSISGDITLRLPDDSAFRLDASTVSGDISTDFDLSGAQAGRRSLTGVAGDGGATLNVGTTSGEITIERR